MRYTFFCLGTLLAAAVAIHIAAQDHHADEAKPTTIIGELIDAGCFISSGGGARGQDHATCATECMSSGVPAAILPEGKQAVDLLILLTNPAVLAPHAAQTIKVEGVVHAEHKAIDVKRLYVKSGDDWKEVTLKDAHHDMGGEKKHEHGAHESTK